MTTTAQTRECSAADATLYLAFELGSTKWVLGFATAPGQRARVRSIPAGDLGALRREIAAAQARFHLGATCRIRSCYEAGRDGFWLHRWLLATGIENVVVDSSSIEVNRRARRAKTDRLDVGKLVQLLMRAAQGEPRVWSVVHVPTEEAEAARQATRELATVRDDRTRIRNRIQALLATQGSRCRLTADFPTRVATLQTGDGRPLPVPLRERLVREWTQLAAVEARQTALQQARDRALREAPDRVSTVARKLSRLRAIAEASAALYSAELFGTRTFQNGRQVGALTGLVPVPYRSDQRVQDQGISKAGRAELRRVSIQIAWCWVRWQPQSALTKWFHERFGRAGGRSRRVGIVAVARKLVIALWRYVEHGVVPDGAVLKPAV